MSEDTQNNNNTPPVSSENPAAKVDMPPLTITNIRGTNENINTKQSSKD